MSSNELLDIVNENDEVIGQVPRSIVHQQGLLHREVLVWMYNVRRGILFQRRSKTKEAWPGMLGASAAGHVTSGMNYEESARKEFEEETGLNVSSDYLRFLRKVRESVQDPTSGIVNNIFKALFLYQFNGDPAELRVEEGESDGFEFWSAGDLLNATQEEKQSIGPWVLQPDRIELFREIERFARV